MYIVHTLYPKSVRPDLDKTTIRLGLSQNSRILNYKDQELIIISTLESSMTFFPIQWIVCSCETRGQKSSIF